MNAKVYEKKNGLITIKGTALTLEKFKTLCDNWTLADIGKKYGVSHGTIHNIVNQAGIRKRYIRYCDYA